MGEFQTAYKGLLGIRDGYCKLEARRPAHGCNIKLECGFRLRTLQVFWTWWWTFSSYRVLENILMSWTTVIFASCISTVKCI